MDDEPLSEWATRRDEQRAGRFRVEVLAPGGPHAAHVHPESPRLVSRWNGYEWEAVTVATDLADAQRVMYPHAEPVAEPDAAEWERPVGPPPDVRPLAPGRGRHRKA
jgi:Family of unknown function (DUF6087)